MEVSKFRKICIYILAIFLIFSPIFISNYSQNKTIVKEIKEKIKSIFVENKGLYGYRRITDELHNRGIKINHKTVQRLMKILGLKSIVRPKRRYSSYKGEIGKIADNLLKRNFKAEKPNQKWATDVTEFKVCVLNFIV